MQKPERLRSTPTLRNFLSENQLRAEDLVLPIFLNSTSTFEIKSMPGVNQWEVEDSLSFVTEARECGIKSFILFGIVPTSQKSPGGEAAWDLKGPVAKALRRYRDSLGDVNLMADACFCEYTNHGHCGPMNSETKLRDTEKTLAGLEKMALCYAESGANIIAPSGMVDGMVATIRNALDKNSFYRTIICSYAVKYASSFYGPFREAAENAPQFGDRKTYQMDISNRKEALREAALDVEQGADMLLVKPGMPCLDVLLEVSNNSSVPVGAYQVSGEYSMIKAAAQRGWVDENKILLESLISFKRAGAKFIISYGAIEAAKMLRG